jgi:glycosyltransferase involved in cell wall biosynthesis
VVQLNEHPSASAGKPSHIRLAALYSHPIQYVAPLCRELASRSDVDLTVYFCSRHGLDVSFDAQFGHTFKWDVPLLEGYRSIFLPNLRLGSSVHGFLRLINPSVIPDLMQQRYDALLIHGYEHLTKWLALLGARLTCTRTILRGESQLLFARPRYVSFAKWLVLRRLMRLISAATYIGQNNYEFYRHYGLAVERLFFAPYVVDNDFFQSQARELAPQRRSLRMALGISDDRPIILAVGKLIPKKQPLFALRAFQQLRREIKCALVFMGDGILRPEIEQVVHDERIPDVTVTGFINQSQMGRVYAAADIFVLPSAREPWGLVVNEAMNFGLPIIASDRVGCGPDLVKSGENGFIVSHRQLETLVASLRLLVSDPDGRRQFGQRSLDIISNYTLARCADGIIAAARA